MLIGHQLRFQRVPASKHEIDILGNEWVWARLSQQHCFGICVANTFWVWESPPHYFCKIGSRTTVPDPGRTLFFSPPPNANGRQEDKAWGHPCIRETVFFFLRGKGRQVSCHFQNLALTLSLLHFRYPFISVLLAILCRNCWVFVAKDADIS